MNGDSNSTVDLTERVAQLQYALTSRIRIEQAKGMLAERYSLTPDDAYELIRLAARSNGVKVHALTEEVLARPRETPAHILALLSQLPKKSFAPGRAVENVFHEINESFLKLHQSDERSHFICECADAACVDTIDLSSEAMRALHEDLDLYAVAPAHIDADLEDVVESFAAFAVVRKHAA